MMKTLKKKKTWKKDIQEDSGKWQNVPGSCVGRIRLVEMVILAKAIYRFIEASIKIPMAVFQKWEKNGLKIHREAQKILATQSNPEQQQKIILEVSTYPTSSRTTEP